MVPDILLPEPSQFSSLPFNATGLSSSLSTPGLPGFHVPGLPTHAPTTPTGQGTFYFNVDNDLLYGENEVLLLAYHFDDDNNDDNDANTTVRPLPHPNDESVPFDPSLN